MRLIDADALIGFIDPEHLRHSSELTFSEVDVINMLNHAPTAYDVDGAIKKLGSCYENSMNGANGLECAYWNKAIDMAMNIVKGGAVDG